MDSIVYLIFRKMRQPLLVLIITHALAILGLTLIPGQDANGEPWRMGFFHAFYFVSYMATTIGFGEIPYAFTDTQRLWVLVSIYATVISWIYAIGALIALVREPGFQYALAQRRFVARVRRLSEPFYLIAGYGSVGSELVDVLTDRHKHVVVIDADPKQIDLLGLQNLREDVIGFAGNAADTQTLLYAGLQHFCCTAVVALTSSNEVNLKIALTTKLLRPDMQVICRSDSASIEANMASFGTDHIVDPFETFAMHLTMALQSPGLYLVRKWLSSPTYIANAEPIYPPLQGKWILCGYGRFGKSVYERLTNEGIEVIVVEATPEVTGKPHHDFVIGRGTEAATLIEAGVQDAVGLVAGTDDDVNNLSIVMTAATINPDLFVILRQNDRRNQAIIDAIDARMVMQPSHIVAQSIQTLLATPLLHDFFTVATARTDDWACALVSRLVAISQDISPAVWETTLDANDAPAVTEQLALGQLITLDMLVEKNQPSVTGLPLIPLLLARDEERLLLPEGSTSLLPGDKLLWTGPQSVKQRLMRTLLDAEQLEYLLTGNTVSRGWIFRRFFNPR